MKTETPSNLADVLKEIVSALLDADWARYSDKSGEHFYYVVRDREHQLEVAGHRPWESVLVFQRRDPDEYEEWYVRSSLAEAPADHLARARKRVKAAGIDPELFDAAIEAARTTDSLGAFREVVKEWLPTFLADERLDAPNAFLEAIRIERTRSGHLVTSDGGRSEIRGALEALLLKELAERYPKAIKRAVGWEWLPFSDKQLREASRCYLYGFRRAALFLAAAAVEARLKEVAEVDELVSYSALVDSVFGAVGARPFDPVRVKALKDLFDLRNVVAHRGVEPSEEQAVEALDLVRGTLEELAKESMNG